MLIFLIGPAAAGKTTVATHIRSLNLGYDHASDLTDLNEQARALKPGNKDQKVARLPRGGFEIIDPTAWDEALKRVAFSHRSTPNLILEFSRGLDQAYLKLHGIEPNEVYNPSFRILRHAFSPRIDNEGLVIMVDAPFEVRDYRNSDRHLAGDHFVDPSEFRKLFHSQLFSWNRQQNHYLIPGTTTVLPVIPLDNTQSPFDHTELELLLEWGSKDE